MAQESAMNISRIYIDWQVLQPGLLSAMERFWHDLPCALVSFGHPYHLYDAPRMPLYVNAYCSTEGAQRATVRKLVGEEPFTGVSPVDPFCGLPDARY
jgi:beta-N-acetylhexosaminidase